MCKCVDYISEGSACKQTYQYCTNINALYIHIMSYFTVSLMIIPLNYQSEKMHTKFALVVYVTIANGHISIPIYGNVTLQLYTVIHPHLAVY